MDIYKAPFGDIFIKTDEKFLLDLSFSLEDIDCVLKETKVSLDVKKQLEEYFNGRRYEFDVPLFLDGTEFQKSVWRELCKIPYGKTLCYEDIAIKIGNPKAARAVGLANNKNNIAIFIPCHRVIGKNGSLTGFAGGLDTKEFLLEHEKKWSRV